MKNRQLHRQLVSNENDPAAPLQSNLLLETYESGPWYFSQVNSRIYPSYIARGLDWLGRKLSFLRRKEYEVVSHLTNQTPGIWGTIKIGLWKSGLGVILGIPGAGLRYLASKWNKMSGRHEKKDKLIISNFRQTDDEIIHDPQKPFNLYTLNAACLPIYRWIPGFKQINRKILRDNNSRAAELAEAILQNDSTEHTVNGNYQTLSLGQRQEADVILKKLMQEKVKLDEAPAVISFQEVFDENAAAILIQKLKNHYPYVVHAVGQGKLTVGSGLMIFSRYPIVDAYFKTYTNTMLGEETLASKGFLGVKIKINTQQFITVYNSHTQSGGGIFKKLSTWWNGTTSYRRGVEFGEMAAHMKKWEKEPPKAEPNLIYQKTFLTGDLNTKLNDERRMISESAGTSALNGFERGQIKYAGQKALFDHFIPTVPTNFIDTREIIHKLEHNTSEEVKEAHSSAGKHQGKKDNPDNIAICNALDLFTGTVPSDAVLISTITKKSPIDHKKSQPKIIDALLMSRTDQPSKEQFFSRIESVGNSTDHHAVRGSWNKYC